MRNKKILGGAVLLILIFSLSGCLNEEPKVDVLAPDNKYHYRNDLLGFQINFPEEFEYYQAQRIEADNYVDMEFLIPTSDIHYPSELVGFAKPVVVRIFDSQYWQENRGSNSIYEELAEKGSKVYTIAFWNNYPQDWENKWSEEMKEEIINSFKLR